MLEFLRKKTAELRHCQSGNAVMLVALGLPVLIGGTGFAVDTAQWYMWKGELQYAADQAAIAGAWAMTKEETEASYVQRAEQEFAANLAQTSEIATDPEVRLEDYASGNDNSVVVTASATKGLPFSFFLTGRIATVAVSAQAAFEEGVVNTTSCLVAVDEDDSGAVTIGGSAEFVAGCGISALSTDEEAISVTGNPTIDAGWLYAKGGIDDWFDDPANSDDLVVEDFEGLFDPFADLEPPYPPQSQTQRTYSCPTGETTTIFTADTMSTRTQTTYTYYERHGSTYTQTTSYSGSAFKANVDNTVTEINPELPTLPASNTVVTGPTTTSYVQVDRVSGTRIYETSTTTVTKTYVNPRESTTANVGGAAVLLPGTYPDLRMSCDTVFTSGVYVLSGGTLEIHAQYDVTGSGVMFVLTNGANIIVNGGANVNLTAMTVSELQAAGVSHEEAVKLEGMLIFEDPDSEGSDTNLLNGNATTILNGTVYLPKSNLDIQGTAGVTSQCLMIVASTITLTGNMAMSSFCPPDMTNDTEVAIDPPRVRLVS